MKLNFIYIIRWDLGGSQSTNTLIQSLSGSSRSQPPLSLSVKPVISQPCQLLFSLLITTGSLAQQQLGRLDLPQRHKELAIVGSTLRVNTTRVAFNFIIQECVPCVLVILKSSLRRGFGKDKQLLLSHDVQPFEFETNFCFLIAVECQFCGLGISISLCCADLHGGVVLACTHKDASQEMLWPTHTMRTNRYS